MPCRTFIESCMICVGGVTRPGCQSGCCKLIFLLGDVPVNRGLPGASQDLAGGPWEVAGGPWGSASPYLPLERSFQFCKSINTMLLIYPQYLQLLLQILSKAFAFCVHIVLVQLKRYIWLFQ